MKNLMQNNLKCVVINFKMTKFIKKYIKLPKHSEKEWKIRNSLPVSSTKHLGKK